MATTGASARAAATAALAYLVLGSCAPAGNTPGLPTPAPEAIPEAPAEAMTLGPEIRVGLAVGATEARAGGIEDLAVTDPAGARLAVIPAGEVWRIGLSATGLTATSPTGASSAPSERLVVLPLSAGNPVRVNGRSYRGQLEVLRDPSGVTLVNRLGLEEYLQGVVSAEMGRRSLEERPALRAQAIVSRTYAMRNMGRRRAQGFDLFATVSDQVYGGLSAETPEGSEAVSSTRGQVLTYKGAPIDAFFYSTCGGRTATGTEAFRAADRPYLRSVSDVAPDGIAYCAISPRYRWREVWTGEALRATLRKTLPGATGTPAARVRQVNDVRVVYRTASGRVGQLVIDLRESEVMVDGPAIRTVLRSPSGDMLRSNAFDLTVTSADHQVTRLVADGGGA
ncbi:MAG: SpoIID/LytB domain-containing protein, partial [Gemmatimonadales bacterium]